MQQSRDTTMKFFIGVISSRLLLLTCIESSLLLDVRLYITYPVLSHLHVSPIYLSASSLSYPINPISFSRFNAFLSLPLPLFPSSSFLPSLFVPQFLLTPGADVCGHGGEPSGLIQNRYMRKITARKKKKSSHSFELKRSRVLCWV